MAFGTRIKKVAFAQATGIPQTFVENGTALTYVPPQRDVQGEGFYMPAVEPRPRPTARMGYWSHTSGRKNVRGIESTPPSRVPGWSWTLNPVPQVVRVEPPPPRPRMPMGTIPSIGGPKIGPEKFNGPPPPEIQRYDALPETPPPGPAVPPQEPMLEAWWRKAQETFMGPPETPGPNFVPERGFPSAQPGGAPPVAVAGMDLQKLILPVGLLAGVFLLMRARG